MKLRKYFALGLMVVFASPAAFAGLVNNATEAEKALAAARPGDEVVLADGVHRDFRLVFNARGEAGRPIAFRAESPGGAIFTGSTRIVLSGEWLELRGMFFDQVRGGEIMLFEKAANCRLTDCAFRGCGNEKSTFSHIVSVTHGSKNNRLDHCYMEGNLSMGMAVRNTGGGDLENFGNRIDHNYYKDIIRRSSNGQEAVQLGQNQRIILPLKTTVEFCRFENASGDSEIISNKTADNVYRNNRFLNCKAALVLRGSERALVEGNEFVNCSGGVRVHGRDHIVRGNRIEGCGFGIVLPSGTHQTKDDTHYQSAARCVIEGNTIVDSKKHGIRLGELKDAIHGDQLRDAAPYDNRFSGNVVVSEAGTLVADEFSERTVWQENVVYAEDKAKAGLKHAGIRQVARRPVILPMKMVFPPVGPEWMNGHPGNLPDLVKPVPVPPIKK